jgi:hypothetical protein
MQYNYTVNAVQLYSIYVSIYSTWCGASIGAAKLDADGGWCIRGSDGDAHVLGEGQARMVRGPHFQGHLPHRQHPRHTQLTPWGGKAWTLEGSTGLEISNSPQTAICKGWTTMF